MKSRDDLYLLQDGTHADPADVSPGKDGILRHKNGLAVCLYADGRPQTVGEDAGRNKNVEAARMGDDIAPVADLVPGRRAAPILTTEGPALAAKPVTPPADANVTVTQGNPQHDTKAS